MTAVQPKHIHLIAACGTGMGSLAGMLKARGYQVKRLPPGLYFEGAGDLLGTRDTWFGGYLQRSDIHAFRYV